MQPLGVAPSPCLLSAAARRRADAAATARTGSCAETDHRIRGYVRLGGAAVSARRGDASEAEAFQLRRAPSGADGCRGPRARQSKVEVKRWTADRNTAEALRFGAPRRSLCSPRSGRRGLRPRARLAFASVYRQLPSHVRRAQLVAPAAGRRGRLADSADSSSASTTFARSRRPRRSTSPSGGRSLCAWHPGDALELEIIADSSWTLAGTMVEQGPKRSEAPRGRPRGSRHTARHGAYSCLLTTLSKVWLDRLAGNRN